MVDIPSPEKTPDINPWEKRDLSLDEAKQWYKLRRDGKVARLPGLTETVPRRRAEHVTQDGQPTEVVLRKIPGISLVDAKVLSKDTHYSTDAERKLAAPHMKKYGTNELNWRRMQERLDNREQVPKSELDSVRNERNTNREINGHLVADWHVDKLYGEEGWSIRRLSLKDYDREIPRVFDSSTGKLNAKSYSGAFDEVFHLTKDGQERFVVVECKGGKGVPGYRMDTTGTLKVQQGTPQYLNAILTRMFDRGGEQAKLALRLLEAWDNNELHYDLVRPIVTRPHRTKYIYELAGWEASRFNINGAAA